MEITVFGGGIAMVCQDHRRHPVFLCRSAFHRHHPLWTERPFLCVFSALSASLRWKARIVPVWSMEGLSGSAFPAFPQVDMSRTYRDLAVRAALPGTAL